MTMLPIIRTEDDGTDEQKQNAMIVKLYDAY